MDRKPYVNFLPLLLFADSSMFYPFFSRCADNIHKFISECLSLLLQTPHSSGDAGFLINSKSESTRMKLCFNGDRDDEDGGRLSRDDVEIVMKNLGFFWGGGEEGEEVREYLLAEELTAMFEEKEPSLEEVKETFNVFDEKGDGFIDAEELQRVLGVLGWTEGEKLENCENMISKFDENKDGKIDLNEFVRLMEITMC